MDELISEFIAETVEGLNMLDTALIAFESTPDDKELLDKIFRTLHTIKGTCGFIGLTRLEKVAHTAETLLDQFRSRKRQAEPNDVALILQSMDRIRQIMDGIQETGNEPAGDDTALLQEIQNAVSGNGMTISAPPIEPVIVMEQASDAIPEIEWPEDNMTIVPEIIPPPPIPVPAPIEEIKPPVKKSHDSAIAITETIRVNVDTLEKMMTMVSELVLTRNQLVQLSRNHSQGTDMLSGSLERLNFIVSELQDGIMKTRMQPIGNAWTKFPRIVHDIAHDLDKKINLDMQGEDTEIDRKVLEMIKDPLMHMVRNAADHGIEEQGERLMVDKDLTGTISLKAWHEGGYIVIQLRDDGRGMDPERIKRTVLSRGLATEEHLATLNDHQLLQYIFQPGFSTAEKVTAVSGRGVGMDVVRTNIEKMGGTIDLESHYGHGSCFTINIPLTLAIVSALIIESDNNRYAIPQLNIQELIKIGPHSQEAIEWVGEKPVLRLRDHILPLASLNNILHNEPVTPANFRHESCYVVIANLGATQFGLIVDHVYDTEEIVVKPVSSPLKPIEIFAGNTILGDGRVIMILDPAGLAKTAKIQIASHMLQNNAPQERTTRDNDLSLLLFKAGEDEQIAVPIYLVSRIEEFPRRRIEFSGGKPVLQYQGRLMDLHILSKNTAQHDTVKALIFADENPAHTFGLVIDEVIDIVDHEMTLKPNSARDGFLGTAIIAGRATEILDVNHYIRAGNWYADEAESFTTMRRNAPKRILLVDDSAFFRNMLHPLLSMAGYAVTMVEGPISALQLCNKGQDFDLIISDIEMEEMNGFNFAEKVKTETRWKHIPMVALSSHATPEDIAMGYEKGFSAYIPKSNRDALLSTLDQMLENTQDVLQEVIA